MAILITHLQNIRYLIGFTGTSGFLLLGKKNVFFTDFRYRGVAKELEKMNSRISFKFVEMDKDFDQKLKKMAGKSLEFEENHMTIAELKAWKKRLKGILFEPAKHTIEEMRLIKDADEIKNLKKSQAINEETLKRIRKLLKNRVAEREIAWKIKEIGHELGADEVSFEPIVAFGKHSAVPHHQNTGAKLKAGDLVLIDMGMKYKGYASDMTRTFLPKKASSEQIHIYETVYEAQEAAIRSVKSGIRCCKLDAIARKSMGRLAKHFGHSLGHGIGLDVHEDPSLSTKSKDILKEGMVVTVEPGIYLSGKFGVRIEDMGLVTESGYENFTRFEK